MISATGSMVTPLLLFPQIRLAYDVTAQQRRGCIMQHNLAALEDVATVCDLQGHTGVLFHQQDRRPLSVDGTNDAENGLNQERCYSHGWLIQQYHLGAPHQ